MFGVLISILYDLINSSKLIFKEDQNVDFFCIDLAYSTRIFLVTLVVPIVIFNK